MKKILLGLLMLLMSQAADAGLISVSVLSNDTQVNYEYFNTAFNTVKNCINGNIESANIKDSTITITDMASSSSPGQREGDHFNAYTKTGMLPVTSTDLTSDISAGTSYVESDAGILYRVVTSATSKTYTASKDTWVYIDIDGAFQYTAQALGAAQPTTPSNSLLLAKVVTDTDNITSVVDHRTLSISLGTSDDFMLNGLTVNWVSTERVSVDTGVVYVGTTRIAKTSYTGLNVGTAGDYITGASERAVSKWLYVYASTDGNLKLDDNAPDYHDTAGNTTGIKYYYKYGSDYWRCLFAIRLNATGSGNVVGYYQQNDKVMYNTPIQITTTVSDAVWSAATSCATAIPPISTLGIFGLYASEAAGNGTGISIRPNGGTWPDLASDSTNAENGIFVLGNNINPRIGGQRICATDSSQQINYYNYTGADATVIDVEGYFINIRD